LSSGFSPEVDERKTCNHKFVVVYDMTYPRFYPFSKCDVCRIQPFQDCNISYKLEQRTCNTGIVMDTNIKILRQFMMWGLSLYLLGVSSSFIRHMVCATNLAVIMNTKLSCIIEVTEYHF
jgi:hypothetical protein